MAARRAIEIQADRIKKTACPKCGNVVDGSSVPPFSKLQCDKCKSRFSAPGKLGGFILLKELGRGQMGVTYKAYEKMLGRYVAIKVMRASLGGDPKRVKEFMAEGRALASLDHPNAVRIYSIGQEKDQPYIAMELVNGHSVGHAMGREKQLSEARALEIATGVGRALRAASVIGLIHSDVKPDNIVLDEKGRAKLVDFGIARFGPGKLEADAAIGTPYYVAPEQVQRGSVDHRTDIYSLGATLYHMIAGTPPFPGTDLETVLNARLKKAAPSLMKSCRGLHMETVHVVAKMLHKDPDRRYQDYDELLKDLRRACWAAGAELTQDPDDAPLEMATPGHGGTAMKLTIAAVLLLGAVGVGAWAMFFRGSGDGGPGNPGAAVQTPAGKVANPVFFPKARRIASPTEIKVSCDTPEAEIFYTIDKTIPTRKSGRWSGSLKIEPGATLRARAFCKGLDPSEIVEAVYARDTVVAAEVVRLRSQAEAAWKPLLKLSRNQGFGAKVDKCTRLYDQGEELYKMKAYADAKKRFSEVLRQCKTLNRDNSMRDLASIAQRKSDAATRDISDFSSSNVWKPIAKISAQAKSSFDRGDFVNAYKQWGQVVGEIDKRYKAMLPDARKKYETAINVPDIETLKKHGGVAWKSVETSAQQGAKFAASGKHAQAVIAYRRAVELLAPARTAASIAVAGARRDAAVKAIGDLIKKKQYYQAKAALGPMFKASPGDSKLQAYDKAISSAIEIKIYLKDGARDTKGGLQMPLRLIQAGTFRRGAPKSESGRGSDEKPHDVKISEPFYIGKTEVTYRQFEHFVKVTGYQTAPEKQKNLRSRVLSHNKLVMTTGGSWRKPGFVQGADHPVVCVSWNDAQAFCDWLTKRAGGMKVSLPSEAQWEYACRRGTTTRFSFGNDDTQLCKYGNYGDGSAPFPVASPVKNSDGKSTTAPVQSYKGANVTPHIYDMHGNVSEWCLDGYGIYQIDKTGKASVDPVAPRRLLYVIRGGSWASTPAKCRSAARGKMNGGWHSAIVGFRVVATGNPARVRR